MHIIYGIKNNNNTNKLPAIVNTAVISQIKPKTINCIQSNFCDTIVRYVNFL